MGIPEYWIVDYLGLGGRRFIGNPKQPTLSVYQLVDGEYQVTLFTGNERIESLAFPELQLSAAEIFAAKTITDKGIIKDSQLSQYKFSFCTNYEYVERS